MNVSVINVSFSFFRRESQLDTRPAGRILSGYRNSAGSTVTEKPPASTGKNGWRPLRQRPCYLEEEGETMAAIWHVKSSSPRGLAEDTSVTALQSTLSPEGLSCFRPYKP